MQEGKERDKKGTTNCLKSYTPAYYCHHPFPTWPVLGASVSTLECWVVMDILGEEGKSTWNPRTTLQNINLKNM